MSQETDTARLARAVSRAAHSVESHAEAIHHAASIARRAGMAVEIDGRPAPEISPENHAAEIHRAAALLANATNCARRAGLSVEVEILEIPATRAAKSVKQTLFLPRVSRAAIPPTQDPDQEKDT